MQRCTVILGRTPGKLMRKINEWIKKGNRSGHSRVISNISYQRNEYCDSALIIYEDEEVGCEE